MQQRRSRTVFVALTLVAAACGGSGQITVSTTAVPGPTSSPAQPSPEPAPSDGDEQGAAPSGRAAVEPWRQLASMNVPRSEAPAAVVDGSVYFAGGLSTGDQGFVAHASTEKYDPSADVWTAVAPMPAARHHHMTAGHGGSLYVFGGFPDGPWAPQDNVWRYDPIPNKWTELTPMPFPIAAGAAVTLEDSIFVIAGLGTDRAVLEFAPASESWIERASLREAREHIAATTAGGLVYVTAGRWSLAGESPTVERFDPSTDSWTLVGSLAVARAGHALAALGESLVAIGGEILGTREALDSVEVYSPTTDRWEPGPTLPVTTHGVAAVAIGDTLYLVGGAPTAGAADGSGQLFSYRP